MIWVGVLILAITMVYIIWDSRKKDKHIKSAYEHIHDLIRESDKMNEEDLETLKLRYENIAKMLGGENDDNS
jgi:uncharacterized protein (UPF0333 family)